MIADLARSVTGGVDTHKDFHVAAAVDHLGVVLGTASFPNGPTGYRDLAGWLCCIGEVQKVGVEGTGSYGAGLSRYLRGHQIKVVEINRLDRSARRRKGKTDVFDAIAAARAALAGLDAGTPKSSDATVESIRILRLVRRSAVQSRTQCANQIHALIDTGPDAVVAQLRGLRFSQVLTWARRCELPIDLSAPEHACTAMLVALARRWVALSTEIAEHSAALNTLVAQASPELIGLFGVGTHVAGALLVASGDNPDRLASEATFAALCGVCPVPASSGKTQRHRLNRGGNRDANQALWRIAMVRMAHDPVTRAYVERRTQQGMSKREIVRCLKRYIAREVFNTLQG